MMKSLWSYVTYIFKQLKQFNEQVLEAIDKLGTLKTGETSTILGSIQVTKSVGNHAILTLKGKNIAIINGKTVQYSLANYQEVKKALEEEGQTLEDLGLPDLEEAIAKIQNQNSEKEQEDGQLEQDEEQPEQEDSDGETIDEEKDDEKPDLEEDKDPKKEEIAKKFNLNARNIVHIANDERVTENERFRGLVEWSKGYDDVYAIPGEDEYSYKFIGSKKGTIEEIETGTNKVIGGRNPDITIKRIDGEQITEIKPIAMYEVDSQTAIAIVKDEHGYPETIYCRQQEGHEKEYWGSIIPEASGKNVEQESPEVRGFMDYRNNSGLDLNKKADELSRQEELEKRGLPSKKQGVQVEEIEGNSQQNRGINIEDIAEDLMKRDGIIDRATVPPGYYEHKAEKVLVLMEGNKNLTYEQAVEQVENEGQREDGGRTPGDKNNRRG